MEQSAENVASKAAGKAAAGKPAAAKAAAGKAATADAHVKKRPAGMKRVRVIGGADASPRDVRWEDGDNAHNRNVFQCKSDNRAKTRYAHLAPAECSHGARVNKFQTCAVGDIAVIVKQFEWYVCCLWYLVDAADGVFFAVVDRYECIDSASDWSRWKVRSNPALEHFDNIFDVLIYEKITGDDGSLLVIHPYALRQVV